VNTEEIKKLLPNYDPEQVDLYCKYVQSLADAKKKDKTLQNPWMGYRKPDHLATYFKKVALDGLFIDGVHITLQSTGVAYDYIAYKNKMLMAYPETVFDISLVYDGDEFKFEKKSGTVSYIHNIANPFNHTDDKIIGGYCIVKNKRGDFLTLLSRADIEKHRKVAKTDSIWRSWFAEMCMKTISKKACKQHFADIFQNIETIDNENFDVALLKTDPGKQETVKDNLEPATKMWAHAITAYCRDGNLDAVEKHVNISPENKKALIAEAGEKK